jgi:predicted site-specific integrase-resolvase
VETENNPEEEEELLTAGEVRAILHLALSTLRRYVKEGKLTRIRTPGNGSRYRKSEVRKLLNGK